MRDLYQEIREYYLLSEALSKEPTSPIRDRKDGQNRSTKLTTYNNDSDFEKPAKYHKSYSGVTHVVSWENNHDAGIMDRKQKKDSLHDAMHLHHHFIKNSTEVGDVVKNMPSPDDENDDDSGNKRARIYAKKAGFGEMNQHGMQYGIIKQHPDDHPDESKRGQKYLHPLEHHEIEAHGDKPSAGASDNTTRHLSRRLSHHENMNMTKHNNSVHYMYSTGSEHEHEHIDYDEKDKNKLNDSKTAHDHLVKKSTKPGDRIKSNTNDDKNRIFRNHHFGYSAPKVDGGSSYQHGKVDKNHKIVPHK